MTDYSSWATVSTDYPGTNTCNACVSYTCQNSGTCSGGTNQLFTCTCPSGFSGVTCELGASRCEAGVFVDGFCACYSGYSSNNCTVPDLGSCPALQTVNLLVTSAVAEFMTSQPFIFNNDLNVVMESPAVSQRYISYVGLSSSACAFPNAGQVFIKGFDTVTCQDSFTVVFSVQDLVSTCGFAVTSDSSHTYITGQVDITVVDALPSFRGIPISRMTSASIGLELSLPTNLTLTSENMTVASPIETLAAITGQDYDSGSDTAFILITTSVQWPFLLISPVVVSYPNAEFNVSITLSDDSQCTTTEGSDCLQVWSVGIMNIALSRQCNVNGNYTFDWDFTCQGGFTSACGVGNGNSIPSITAMLASDDVCATVSVVSNIVGGLTSYDDSYTTEVITYVSNGVIYLEAAVTADVTISSFALGQVRVVQNGVPLVIYNFPSEVDPSLNFGFGSDTGSVMQFNFVAVDAASPSFFIFNADGGDNVFSFTVEADLIVTYQTTVTRKREAATTSLPLKKSLVFAHTPKTNDLAIDDSTTGATSVTASSVLIAAAAIAGLAVLV